MLDSYAPRWRGIFAVCLFALAGCVTQSADDAGTVSFGYAGWATGSCLAGGVITTVFGAAVCRKSKSWGIFVILAGLFVAGLIAPSVGRDSVVISNEGVVVHSGIWGMTANQDVRFENVRQIRITEDSTRGRRPRMIDTLHFEINGVDTPLALNNEVKVAAARRILQTAQERGIPVVGVLRH